MATTPDVRADSAFPAREMQALYGRAIVASEWKAASLHSSETSCEGAPKVPVPGPEEPHRSTGSPVDFKAINGAALGVLPALLARWLPGGAVKGHEYIARNPLRADRSPGSFSINIRTGRWADFATGDKGGDVVSLAAYLHGLGQLEAARRLAVMLGLSDAGGENGHRD